MDMNQRKLTRSEWDSIEVPVSPDELEVLSLIKNGYHNVSIKYNKHNSLFSYLKIEYAKQMEDYLYNLFFAPKIEELAKRFDALFLKLDIKAKITINKADKIRIERNDISKLNKDNVYELLLLHHIELLLSNKKANSTKWLFHYFTLYKLLKNTVTLVNANIKEVCARIFAQYEEHIQYENVVANSVEYIERNHCLLKYEDQTLYTHQKEIFTAVKMPNPKLILYIAPTGTGKTLTPIGLSESHRVIFVCAARHVGLALARAAISSQKKVAFAFGCMSAGDIRLHYYAAKEYTVNKRTGGIKKVDNSVGDKVEIMICDIQSYIYAMHYMVAFNEKEHIITYWDEPTITFDYDSHPFHEIIKQNWVENIIPNMVLSSATLPKLHELTETVADFRDAFPNATIQNIVSHDCRKSIPIVNNDGFVVMPHFIAEAYNDMQTTVTHCENYFTILRYFDLEETARFIDYVDKNNLVPNNMKIERRFGSFDDCTMQNIKLHYLNALKSITPSNWTSVFNYFKVTRTRKIAPNNTVDPKGNKIRKTYSLGLETTNTNTSYEGKPLTRMVSEQPAKAPPSGDYVPGSCAVYVTTKDAYTLTDGPTIFLAQDVEKISKFCIQQANIPVKMMEEIMKKIENNNVINEKVSELEKELEDLLEDSGNSDGTQARYSTDKNGKKNDKKIERSFTNEKAGDKTGVSHLKQQIDGLKSLIKPASLNNTFVPNKLEHIERWAEELRPKNAFTCDIDDDTIIKIMMLTDVADSWKVLLLMGIGVFTNHKNIAYTEIMKSLADKQQLFLIISSSDYIYGTNYQFCHGYISKDLNMTQEKIIQAMGRIGRNNIQQTYSIRCRDDEHVRKLFTPDAAKPEVINMNILFNRNNCRYDGTNYVISEKEE